MDLAILDCCSGEVDFDGGGSWRTAMSCDMSLGDLDLERSTNSPERLHATLTISWTCNWGLLLFSGLGVVETRRLGGSAGFVRVTRGAWE